jgi:hypothetical protein
MGEWSDGRRAEAVAGFRLAIAPVLWILPHVARHRLDPSLS